MKTIVHDISRGQRLFIGNQYDKDILTVEFVGYERQFSNSTIKLAWKGPEAGYLIDLNDFKLEITELLTMECGTIFCQIVENDLSDHRRQAHSKVFKVVVAPSIKGAQDFDPGEYDRLKSFYRNIQILYDRLTDKLNNGDFTYQLTDQDKEDIANIVDDKNKGQTLSKFTAEWLNDTEIYPYGTLLVYSDYTTVGEADGSTHYVPAFKVADGEHTVQELPFTSAEHITKLDHSLTIGDYVYDGTEDVYVPVYDGSYERG